MPAVYDLLLRMRAGKFILKKNKNNIYTMLFCKKKLSAGSASRFVKKFFTRPLSGCDFLLISSVHSRISDKAD